MGGRTLVVMSEATAERLGRDARLGRLLRLVLLPIAAGLAGMFALDVVVGDTAATVIALGAVAVFLSWETAGPGGRRRRALMVELEAAIAGLQSGDVRGFDADVVIVDDPAGTAAPAPEVDGDEGMGTEGRWTP